MPILVKETSLFPDTLFESVEYEPGQSQRQWWAIFTKARQEKRLARELLRFSIPFFLPLVPKENRIRGRIVKSHIPLFGGYVFLFGCDDERARCLTTNRVAEMLRVGDQERLRLDLMQLNRLIRWKVPLTIERRLEAGRRVRIRHGSLRGLEGVITHRRGGNRRLLVAVEFLQHGVSVEIDDYMVEPA